MKITVRFYSELLRNEVTREFDNYAEAFAFAKTVNGIVVG
jgi:hypothetical protein